MTEVNLSNDILVLIDRLDLPLEFGQIVVKIWTDKSNFPLIRQHVLGNFWWN